MKEVLRRRVSLHHTDAAGILFYGRIFELCQEAAESHLRDLGLPLSKLLEQPWILPLVHAEADYLAPLRVDDEVEIRLQVADSGTTSLTLHFEFHGPKGLHARAKTIQVSVDRKTFQKIPMPESLRPRS